MGIFKFSKKKDVLDLRERYRKQQEKIANMQTENQTPNQVSQSQESPAFSFLGDLASSSQTQSDSYANVSGDLEDKRKRLAKRLMDMTNKIEELSNQIYHLQQRVEVLERKAGVKGVE